MKTEKAYMQVYESLRRAIISGAYTHGQKLPSKRSLAASYGVSVITVEHACDLLMEEGYIQSKERSGYYVIYDEHSNFSVSEDARPINLISRTKAPFPSSVYAKAVRKVLTDYDTALFQSMPHNGSPELKESLSRYLARSRGIHVTPEQIIIGSGAEYLYGLIIQLLGRERLYGIESPSYAKIEQVYHANGVNVEHLPLGNNGITSEALKNAHAEILHLSPYRSYPTGITSTASKKREYLRYANERSAYLIEDDFESEFTPKSKPEETLFTLDTTGRVIYINTFSKTIAPSIRVGYMLLSPALLEEFREKLGFYSCTVPLLDQLVLSELISSGNFERHINRIRRQNRKNIKL